MLACAGALAAYPAVSAARLSWLHAAIGAGAFALLGAGSILRRPGPIAWAVVLLGTDYAVWLTQGTHALDQRAPIVGAGLLLLAELAFDSIDPEPGRPERTAVLSRAITLAAAVFAAVAAGALVVASSSIPLHGGIGLTVVGVLAVLLVIGLVARLAGERR